MSQSIPQNSLNSTEGLSTESPCFCEKKTCLLGLASIAIGVGGFILANLL